MRKLFSFVFIFLLLTPFHFLQAKEVGLVLGVASQYPMHVHYEFLNGNSILAEGHLSIVAQ